jgi:RimJ/RimL family protein N-acetyltransferase
MDVNKIVAIVFIDNNNCKRLLEKFGFKKVGKEETMFRRSMYLHDVCELELLKG